MTELKILSNLLHATKLLRRRPRGLWIPKTAFLKMRKEDQGLTVGTEDLGRFRITPV